MARRSKKHSANLKNLHRAYAAKASAKQQNIQRDECDKENALIHPEAAHDRRNDGNGSKSAGEVEKTGDSRRFQAIQARTIQVHTQMMNTFNEICQPTWSEYSEPCTPHQSVDSPHMSPARSPGSSTHRPRATVEEVPDEGDPLVNHSATWSLPDDAPYLMDIDYNAESGATPTMNLVSAKIDNIDSPVLAPILPVVPAVVEEPVGAVSEKGPSSSTLDRVSDGHHEPPPSIADALVALADLEQILRPRRKSGKGHLPFKGDDALRSRLEQMKTFLKRYAHGSMGWMTASINVAHDSDRNIYMAKQIRKWTRAFISNRQALPYSGLVNGHWNACLLDQKPDLKTDIVDHLQSIGKYVRAQDIVDFTLKPDVQQRHGLKKHICLATAQTWMKRLDYRWTKEPSGQFIDGHERDDVVAYRNKVFLPALAELDPNVLHFDPTTGTVIPIPTGSSQSRGSGPRVVYWFHDESTFYAHDRRIIRWVHKGEKPVPRKKGEGSSLMVADFVSADFGWLRSPDGKETARVLFKAGSSRDGWFTNEDILAQVDVAMEILEKHFPGIKHVFIFDNAKTHTKRADDALSARRMSMKPTKDGNPLFGVDVKQKMPNGEEVKVRVRMADAKFADGRPQSLYFPADHPTPGIFKGMSKILAERGIDVTGLRAECKNFKCPPPKLDCCCRRILYNQPDFRDVESILEAHCRERGARVIFLPKFHCELNPIEQCWGAAKREYRMCPASSSESDLERNVIAALDSITLAEIRRFFIRANRFMDAYRRGLTGKQAAWAAKKYRGHRVLPNHIFSILEKEGIKAT